MTDLLTPPVQFEQPLSAEELSVLDRYWRAANYLSVGQIYLLANPLLREPLTLEHVKPRLLGHWGTTPGLNFVYAHLNRLIRERDLSVLYVTGPGHGGPGLVANTYLEGTYTEVYPHIGHDEEGLRRLFRQFSFPGGIPSHVAPETPGSIHEGGELGYAMVHAHGAAFDNPELLVCCVIGDGEAETGPLAASWHSNKFLNAARDGAVLPVLHLNGYKIANPTVLARIPERELRALLEGYGYAPRFVEGSEPEAMHQLMAATLDEVADDIAEIQSRARGRPRAAWPMTLRTRGWTGPKVVDGLPAEGSFRSHQVPLSNLAHDPRRAVGGVDALLPPRSSSTPRAPMPEVAAQAPRGTAMPTPTPTAAPSTRAGAPGLPDAVDVLSANSSEATRVLGGFLRDVMRANPETFRLFGPTDGVEPARSDLRGDRPRLGGRDLPTDDHVGRARDGGAQRAPLPGLAGGLPADRSPRSVLLLRGIHPHRGLDVQPAREVAEGHARHPVASTDSVLELSADVARLASGSQRLLPPGSGLHRPRGQQEGRDRPRLPPTGRQLPAVGCRPLPALARLRQRDRGRQAAGARLPLHRRGGRALHAWSRDLGVGEHHRGEEPDVVLACAGDIPTLETVAAAALLREHLPQLRVRVINVVDLMRLQPESEHPHGLSDSQFDALFTTDRPVIFAYHGYPWLIHRLTYRRRNHANLHVRGYKEEGTTTTPFDILMLNDLDRFHLVIDVIDRVPTLGSRCAGLRQAMVDERLRHRAYTRETGDDPSDIRDWTWPA